MRAAPELPAQRLVGYEFQRRVHAWMMTCFGPEIAGDRIERNHRFIEEALELVQALGCSRSEAHQLVDYVFDRPAGDPSQEAGGVMVTLAALLNAANIDLGDTAETELARVWTKVEAIRAKQAAKPKHSPLPTALKPELIYWTVYDEEEPWGLFCHGHVDPEIFTVDDVLRAVQSADLDQATITKLIHLVPKMEPRFITQFDGDEGDDPEMQPNEESPWRWCEASDRGAQPVTGVSLQ